RSVFVAFILAVSISAGIGGLGPGILSTSIISMYGVWFVTRQAALAHSAQPDHAVVALFAFIGLSISLLGDGLYRARRRAGREEEALEHSEQRFRLLVDNVVDYAILLLDSQGNVSSWNPGAERITGYSEFEIVGKNFSILHGQGESAGAEAESA